MRGKIMIHLRYTLQSDEQCKTPGEVLRYYRQFKNISTRELAERVGVVPATIVLYENDRHPIDYKVATTCAEVLGIEPERLYDEYLHASEELLTDTKVQFANAKVAVEQPFPQEDELKTKSTRLDELNILLNLDKRENEIVDGEREEDEPEAPGRDAPEWER